MSKAAATSQPVVAASGPKPSQSQPTASTSSSSASHDLTPYLGLPLRLTLTNGSHVVGLLFAHDPSTGLVTLETGYNPHAPPAYPSTAAAAPNQRRTAAVVAAQGGAPRREPTGFKLIKERMVRDVVVLAPTTAEAASQGPPAVGANGGASAAAAASNHPSEAPLPGAQHIFAKGLSEVTPVDVNMAEKREVAASREAQARASRIGVGVTETGQEIFEALSKTLPIRWHEKHIIIMDEVTLSDPYDATALRVPRYSADLLRKLAAGDDVAASDLPTGDDVPTARGKARSWERVGKVLEGERRKMAARRAAQGGGL